MNTRVSMIKILGMVKLLQSIGHDIRIPFLHDRPLTILFYREFENPNPKIITFKTLSKAYDLLKDMWCESS